MACRPELANTEDHHENRDTASDASLHKDLLTRLRWPGAAAPPNYELSSRPQASDPLQHKPRPIILYRSHRWRISSWPNRLMRQPEHLLQRQPSPSLRNDKAYLSEPLSHHAGISPPFNRSLKAACLATRYFAH